jgi:hypothetical protein
MLGGGSSVELADLENRRSGDFFDSSILLNRFEVEASEGTQEDPPSATAIASGSRLFLQRDPNGYEDSVNLYAGMAWDPVNGRDPTGRQVPSPNNRCLAGSLVVPCAEDEDEELPPLGEAMAVAGPLTIADLGTGFVFLGSEEGMQKREAIRGSIRQRLTIRTRPRSVAAEDFAENLLLTILLEGAGAQGTLAGRAPVIDDIAVLRQAPVAAADDLARVLDDLTLTIDDLPRNMRPNFNVPEQALSTALVRGVRAQVRIKASSFTAAERETLARLLHQTNIRIAQGHETAIVGQKVPFRSYHSRRYVRDTLFPGRPVDQVRVSDAQTALGLDVPVNVDEIVPRFIGGRQVTANQRIITERINLGLGPLEERSVRGLPEGTRILGFDLVFY